MHQRTLDFSASQLIRVLFSDPSYEGLRDYFAQLILSIYPGCDAVATVVPPGIREDELLETAAKQRFDLAILILNNVFYAPYGFGLAYCHPRFRWHLANEKNDLPV